MGQEIQKMNLELINSLIFAQRNNRTDLESVLIPKMCKKSHRFNGGKSIIIRFLTKVCFGLSDCWYWFGCTDEIGYGRLVHYKGENKAHRISWLLFKGDIPKGLKVLHKCDIRNCVNPDHLFLGTQKENVQDMFKKGRQHSNRAPEGERNHMSKLTEEKVKSIRDLHSKGTITQKALSAMFNVSPMTICRVVNKKLWRNI